MPIAVISDEAGVGVGVTEVGRGYGEGVDKVFAFFYEQAAAGVSTARLREGKE